MIYAVAQSLIYVFILIKITNELTTHDQQTCSNSGLSVFSKIRRKSSFLDDDEKNNRKKSNAIKKERLKKEDHLSTIFMGYVLVFLICHTPRLVLNFYELTAIRRGLECERSVKIRAN